MFSKWLLSCPVAQPAHSILGITLASYVHTQVTPLVFSTGLHKMHVQKVEGLCASLFFSFLIACISYPEALVLKVLAGH